MKFSEPRVEGDHGCDFPIVGDKAYSVADANGLQSGEASDWPFACSVLTLVNLSTPPPEKSVVFAASGSPGSVPYLPSRCRSLGSLNAAP